MVDPILEPIHRTGELPLDVLAFLCQLQVGLSFFQKGIELSRGVDGLREAGAIALDLLDLVLVAPDLGLGQKALQLVEALLLPGNIKGTSAALPLWR